MVKLQFGKNQDDSSQDAGHGYNFNNIGCIDDISIFDETPKGMHTLLDVVQEFKMKWRLLLLLLVKK